MAPRLVARGLAMAAMLSLARADLGIELPKMPDLTPWNDRTQVNLCSEELLTKYPSGWPLQLDSAIYWYGAGDNFRKAVPGVANPYYDRSKPTLLYFHGWNGDGTTARCQRSTTVCPPDLCPVPGGGQLTQLADSWLDANWNVGFFYWDQFADEPCMQDAEQKIWFDGEGDGLRWASYNPYNGTASYQLGQSRRALSVADICADAVRENMGDYLGPSVRFVGSSIGAQLAVRCAAKLHLEGHRAAPQRMALLEPFSASRSMFVMGYSLRCDKIVNDDGSEGFAAAATANLVVGLWNQSRVATEVYSSTAPNAADEGGAEGQANRQIAAYSAVVVYDPKWCGPSCAHSAVLPLYFLGYGGPALSLVNYVPMDASECPVPSSSCTDAQIRGFVERQLNQAVPQIWKQMPEGTNTLDQADDEFVVDPPISGPVQASEIVELEVSRTAAVLDRSDQPRILVGKRWYRLGELVENSIQGLKYNAVGLVILVVLFLMSRACIALPAHLASLSRSQKDSQQWRPQTSGGIAVEDSFYTNYSNQSHDKSSLMSDDEESVPFC